MIKKLYIILGLAAITVSGTVFGEDCPPGLDGNLCRAENGDRRAMYMVARAAYVEENEAIKNAIKKGAEKKSIEIIDLEEIPLSYLPSNAVTIKTRAIGNISNEFN